MLNYQRIPHEISISIWSLSNDNMCNKWLPAQLVHSCPFWFHQLHGLQKNPPLIDDFQRSSQLETYIFSLDLLKGFPINKKSSLLIPQMVDFLLGKPVRGFPMHFPIEMIDASHVWHHLRAPILAALTYSPVCFPFKAAKLQNQQSHWL